MMDPTATIKQVNSDIKEYDEKLVRTSNIPLDYIVDNKLGHYWYKYVTRDVLSDVTEENSTHLIEIQSTMNKRGQGGGRVYTPETTHMIISIGSTSIIRLWTIVLLYITKLSWSYTWSYQIISKISLIITGTCNFIMRGGRVQANPILSLSYISLISSIH